MELRHSGNLLNRIAFVWVWVYFFSVPFEYSIVLREPLESYARVTGVLSLLAGVAVVAIEGRARRWEPVHWITLLYLSLISISLLWDRAPGKEAEHALREYYQVVPVLFLSWQFARDVERRTLLIVGYLTGGILSSLLMMREAFVLHEALYSTFRYSVGEWNPNELAIVFAVGLPLSVYLAIDRSVCASRRQVVIAWLYLPLASTALLLTGSRTGLVTGAVGLMGIPFSLSKASGAGRYGLASIFALLLLIGVTMIPPGTWEILMTVGSQVSSGDLDERAKIWRFGWHAFWDSPLFGSGVGSFRWASGSLYNAHSTYLEVLVEQGMTGLLLILLVIEVSFAQLKRVAASSRFAGGLLLLTWATAATVGHLAERRVTWVVFSLAALFACNPVIRRVNPREEVRCSPPEIGKMLGGS